MEHTGKFQKLYRFETQLDWGGDWGPKQKEQSKNKPDKGVFNSGKKSSRDNINKVELKTLKDGNITALKVQLSKAETAMNDAKNKYDMRREQLESWKKSKEQAIRSKEQAYYDEEYANLVKTHGGKELMTLVVKADVQKKARENTKNKIDKGIAFINQQVDVKLVAADKQYRAAINNKNVVEDKVVQIQNIKKQELLTLQKNKKEGIANAAIAKFNKGVRDYQTLATQTSKAKEMIAQKLSTITIQYNGMQTALENATKAYNSNPTDRQNQQQLEMTTAHFNKLQNQKNKLENDLAYANKVESKRNKENMGSIKSDQLNGVVINNIYKNK